MASKMKAMAWLAFIVHALPMVSWTSDLTGHSQLQYPDLRIFSIGYLSVHLGVDILALGMVAFGDLHVEDGMVSGVRMRGGGVVISIIAVMLRTMRLCKVQTEGAVILAIASCLIGADDNVQHPLTLFHHH
jgi:hypothetical protein